MTVLQAQAHPISARMLAAGAGWRVQEVNCYSGPADRPFEERHGWTSIAAVMAGVFTYRSDRGRAVMVPGALMLGTAGTCFQCGHEHGTGDRCISFQFSPDFIEDVAGGLKSARGTAFTRPSLAPDDRLLPLLAEARRLVRAPDPLHAEQVAISMAAAALSLDQDAILSPADIRDEARAARAIQIIEARLAKPLTIADLAREVGMTRRRFATCFRQVIGETPYSYILNRRLDAAAQRLRTGSGRVLDIALETGFGDLSEFTRRFHARFGRPPGDYKRLTGERG
jgi:AraC-like DNA-binding protein